MTDEQLAEIEAQSMALRDGWMRVRDESHEGGWALYSIPPQPALADDYDALLAEVRRLRPLVTELIEALEDCISEVEGKAYLKDYVKAGYDETLAKAYEALGLPVSV